MASKKERLDILRRARERLSKPGAWTKGEYARLADGTGSLAWLPRIEVCWCAFGALRAEDPSHSREAAEELYPHLPGGLTLPEFNDACDDAAPVLDLYDRAIARLEAELSHA